VTKPQLLLTASLVGALLVAVPSPGAALDITGDWHFSVSDTWKKGPCPKGRGGPGDIKITQDGSTVTLVFVKGRKCRPASMCTFTGSFSGDTLEVSNSARVDDEGGMAKNAISLTFSGAKSAEGTSESSYTHPGGMQCRWGSKLTLTR